MDGLGRLQEDWTEQTQYGGEGGYLQQQQQQDVAMQQMDSTGPFADMDMQYSVATAGQQQQQPHQHQGYAPTGQGQPADAQAEASRWQQEFYKLAAAVGVPVGPNTRPEAVIEQASAARQRDPWVQAQAREAAMQVQAAVLTAQNIHLRRELGSGWAAADSNMIQVQQLILDPAIEHEFQHLRAQLALRVAETEAAKAAFEGQAFTPESNNGKALLRKLKVLAEENEDLGRQQRETKQAAQNAVAAVERRHADELREELQDARDLCAFYQQENEELNMVATLFTRQLEQIKQQLAAQPAPVPDRDYGRDRPTNRDRPGARPAERGPDRDRDRSRPSAPDRDGVRSPDRMRGGDRSGTDRSRDRSTDRPTGQREQASSYDMDRSGRGGRGGGYDRGRGYGRGRGRNLAHQYAGGRRT